MNINTVLKKDNFEVQRPAPLNSPLKAQINRIILDISHIKDILEIDLMGKILENNVILKKGPRGSFKLQTSD